MSDKKVSDPFHVADDLSDLSDEDLDALDRDTSSIGFRDAMDREMDIAAGIIDFDDDDLEQDDDDFSRFDCGWDDDELEDETFEYIIGDGVRVTVHADDIFVNEHGQTCFEYLDPETGEMTEYSVDEDEEEDSQMELEFDENDLELTADEIEWLQNMSYLPKKTNTSWGGSSWGSNRSYSSGYTARTKCDDDILRMTEDFPGLCHIRASREHTVAMHFVRLSCFYELRLPSIRGHYFTLEKLMDEYAKWKLGKFSFLSDWGGFNVPGWAVLKFYEIFDQPENGRLLMEKEKWTREQIIKIVGKDRWESGDFYLIGTYDEYEADEDYTSTVVEHEQAHGLWYLCPDYREKMGRILAQDTSTRSSARGKLTMYDPSVALDECNASEATSTWGDGRKLFLETIGREDDAAKVRDRKVTSSYQKPTEKKNAGKQKGKGSGGKSSIGNGHAGDQSMSSASVIDIDDLNSDIDFDIVSP